MVSTLSSTTLTPTATLLPTLSFTRTGLFEDLAEALPARVEPVEPGFDLYDPDSVCAAGQPLLPASLSLL
jgi:hypothetical protein